MSMGRATGHVSVYAGNDRRTQMHNVLHHAVVRIFPSMNANEAPVSLPARIHRRVGRSLPAAAVLFRE